MPIEPEDAEKSPAKRIYDAAGPWAEAFKTLIQMAVGVVIAIYVINSAWDFLTLRSLHEGLQYFELEHRTVLGAIGYGLVISAGLDLAYMLFTSELDEAIEPLIVALSAGAILLLSNDDLARTWLMPLALVVIVASIAALFWVKKAFLEEK